MGQLSVEKLVLPGQVSAEINKSWLHVVAVIDLFSGRVVGWSMKADMTAQLVTDALLRRSGGAANLTRCCVTRTAARNIAAISSSGRWPTMASSAR